MRFNRLSAALLGVLSLAPAAYLVLYTMYLAPKLFALAQPSGVPQREYFAMFDTLFKLHTAAVLVAFGLMAYYVLLIHRGEFVPVAKRSLWTLLVIFGNIVVMPVFWYLFVWRSVSEGPASGSA